MSTAPRPRIVPPRPTNMWVRPLLYYGSIVLFAMLILGVTYTFFVEAPPPRQLVIATGSSEGAYYQYAQKYAQLLKKDGLTLEVRVTRGSVENLQLLQDDSSDVILAIVQGGVPDEAARANLTALGSLYREPLWVFYRGEQAIDTLGQLAGKRVAIGPPGSGTRAVAEMLLRENGITEKQATLLPGTGKHAAEELEQGTVDAVFLVASVEASYIQQLFRAPGIRLVSLIQQQAYTHRYHFLAPVSVPAGVIDLGKNIPSNELHLVAPTAMLVARKGLHPALVPMLLAAATQVHRSGDLISKSNEFPSPLYTDLPLDEDARHYYQSGPPWLQRFLPFWLATLVDRLKVMLIPLIMLLMPMFRLAPPLVRWRNRRKIYLWYNLLREVEDRVHCGLSVDEAREELVKLQVIEHELPNLDVPLSYMGELYTLRFHLTLVRQELEQAIEGNHPVVPPAIR